MTDTIQYASIADTARAADLRRRVRDAMEAEPVEWQCPTRIDERFMSEPLAVRKARAIALKLAQMPTDLWEGQLFAGSMTLERPRLHAEHSFPDYLTDAEKELAKREGLGVWGFGHIVPDYPALVAKGLRGIRVDAVRQMPGASTDAERAFLESVTVALDGVIAFAERLARRCEDEAARHGYGARAEELYRMASDLRQAPAGPSRTFRQALQSVWLLHMVFHSTMNGNAMGRLDQYVWPLLERDLAAGRITMEEAFEAVDVLLPQVQRAGQDHRRAVARGPLRRNAGPRPPHAALHFVANRYAPRLRRRDKPLAPEHRHRRPHAGYGGRHQSADFPPPRGLPPQPDDQPPRNRPRPPRLSR